LFFLFFRSLIFGLAHIVDKLNIKNEISILFYDNNQGKKKKKKKIIHFYHFSQSSYSNFIYISLC
jgi:hypothetical protein